MPISEFTVLSIVIGTMSLVVAFATLVLRIIEMARSK